MDRDDGCGACSDGFEQRYWSLLPDTTNPFLSDLVATKSPSSATVTTNTITITSTTTTATTIRQATFSQEQPYSPILTTSEANNTIISSIRSDEGTFPSAPETQLTTDVPIVLHGNEALECIVCGKPLAHLDPARIEYHMNECIDRQQSEQQALESMDMDSTLPPQTSSDQSRFAGAQVDYLSRVKRCPICKQDWPLKGKGKAGASLQPRKAKDKVEHMKRCAKSHNWTAQSLVYQIRIMKEAYERSSTTGSGTIPSSQGLDAKGKENENGGSTAHPEKEEEYAAEEDKGEKGKSAKARKPKAITTVKRQVMSLADTTDVDFESDAIITTVHAPAPTRPSKLDNLRRFEEDQADEGLQLALAISMSVQSSDRVDAGSGSGLSSVWSMTPLIKSGTRGDNGKRRRRKIDLDKNTTTVLPYAEVQHLIQANVHALLFPETEDISTSSSGSGNTSSRSSSRPRSRMEDGHNDNDDMPQEHADEIPGPLKTPPYRPSRFTGSTKADLGGNSLSQSSEPESELPQKSLWSLSHLKDTRDVNDLDLNMPTRHEEPQDDEEVPKDNQPRLMFDREQYVSRFMRRYLRRDRDDTIASRNDPMWLESSITAVPSGSEFKQPPQQQDNKFLSPLWSASKSRRISFKEHKDINQEAFTNALKREIVGHLDVMEQQIQQVKMDTYQKILGSIRRHPIAAGLPATEPIDLLEIEDGSESDLSDHANQEMDSYPMPVSPLLRYSKPAEVEEPISFTLKDVHYEQRRHSLFSTEKHKDVRMDADMQPRLDHNLNSDQEVYHHDDDVQTGTMAYSPSLASPQNGTAFTATRDTSPIELDEGLLQSPEVSFLLDEEDSFSRRLTLSSVSDILPPPLDFAKMGYHNAASLSQQQSVVEQITTSSQTTSTRTTVRFDYTLSPPIDRDTGQNSGTSGMMTPKRNRRPLRDIGNRGIGIEETNDYNLENADEPLRMPSRPRSAGRFRTGLPVPEPIPSLLPSLQAVARKPEHTKSRFHGLPLLGSASRPTDTQSTEDQRNHEGFEGTEQGAESAYSQRSILSSSQPVASNNRTAAMDIQDLPRTPPHNRVRTGNNRIGVRGNGRSATTTTAATAATAKPKKKKKSAAVIRAEFLASRSAMAVARLRAQGTMPDYKNMSLARLRLAATTFGLKEGTTKGALVQKLTRIWEQLNQDRESGDAEGGENHGDDAQNHGGDGNQDQNQSQNQSQDVNQSRYQRTEQTSMEMGVRRRAVYDLNDEANDDFDLSRSGTNQGTLVYDLGRSVNGANTSPIQRRLLHSSTPRAKSTGQTSTTYVRGESSSRGYSSGSVDLNGGSVLSESHARRDQIDVNDEEGDDEEDESEELTEDEEHDDTRSRLEVGLELEDDDLPSSQNGSVMTTQTLERRLFQFLNSASHLRKQFLAYKIWNKCGESVKRRILFALECSCGGFWINKASSSLYLRTRPLEAGAKQTPGNACVSPSEQDTLYSTVE
ncbi:hypothetical protein BGX34_004215 [Mortierella sp. NVP85]|nr:hypothetical protein BGX34_004215 [Mortierella sp. NVP85]